MRWLALLASLFVGVQHQWQGGVAWAVALDMLLSIAVILILQPTLAILSEVRVYMARCLLRSPGKEHTEQAVQSDRVGRSPLQPAERLGLCSLSDLLGTERGLARSTCDIFSTRAGACAFVGPH